MPKAKEEVFEAVFDVSSVKQYASLAQARAQNPLYLIVSYNSERYNGNWLRVWEINNLQKPGTGFIKGLWMSGTIFSTSCSWFPGDAYGNIIDPNGESREFTCSGWSTVAIQILRKLDKLYKYDSWVQFDLANENEKLKLKLEKAQKENENLKAELAARSQ